MPESIYQLVLLVLIFAVSMFVGYVWNIKLPEFVDRVEHARRKADKYTQYYSD